MNPAVKYSLGRLGLFVVVFAALLPVPLNFLVRAMVALVVSAVASYFLLASWRNQMNEQLVGAASRRTAEKQRLRAALAGDEDAAAAGDRAASKDEVPAADAKVPAAADAKVPATADATVEDDAEAADRKAAADADK
ncbi:DUF4229 domain-containing protein [Paractinoplanes atraurantiacus]|uniref:DUF4229 domain-containing protein n=1 Tax=Paractinoplanes atraurantiacus TaxID=1036182 RepID=A0A285K5W2_9ACTN|nr:DUF4229 domain-containing protein [Actinoplanes atraurantiacus]SNY67982.1 Protein of unknown function [Actinoplanes atraurantiacus]